MNYVSQNVKMNGNEKNCLIIVLMYFQCFLYVFQFLVVWEDYLSFAFDFYFSLIIIKVMIRNRKQVKFTTFSGNIELYLEKAASVCCFFDGLFVLVESACDPTLLSEPEEDFDGLLLFKSNSSFKFTVTSPLEMSIFLITMPTSLCPKRRKMINLRIHIRTKTTNQKNN